MTDSAIHLIKISSINNLLTGRVFLILILIFLILSPGLMDDDLDIELNQELDQIIDNEEQLQQREGGGDNSIFNRFEQARIVDERDAQWGFQMIPFNATRQGWLINIQSAIIKDDEWSGGRSVLSLYFIDENGEYFKAKLVAHPYFYLKCKPGKIMHYCHF